MENYNDQGFCLMVLPNGVGSSSDIMKVSICVCVNMNYSPFDPDSPGRDAKLSAFYDSLRKLPSLFDTDSIKINVSNAAQNSTTLTCSLTNSPYYHGPSQCDFNVYQEGVKNLWNGLFPERATNPKSYLPKRQVGPVKNLFGKPEDKTPVLWATKSILDRVKKWQPADAEYHPLNPMPDRLFQTFKTFTSLAKSKVYTEKVKRLDFLKEMLGANLRVNFESAVNERTKDAMFNFAMGLEDKAFGAYLSGNVDIDEVVSTYSGLSSHPFLMRLFGLIVDGQIQLPANYVPPADHDSSVDSRGAPSFYLQYASGGTSDPGFNSFITPIRAIQKSGKYAYLVQAEPNSYFQNSLLSEDGCELINYDRVAKEIQSRAALEREQQNGRMNLSEAADNNPRGIIYTNKHLHEIIKAVDVPADLVLSEEHVSHGLRVGAMITAPGQDRPEVFSLTKRDVELTYCPDQKKEPVVLVGRMPIESCIHIDAPVEAIFDETDPGQPAIGHITADAVFEFSGQLLKLKSIFSKANKTSKLQAFYDRQNSVAGKGTHKSQARIDQVLSFEFFPFVEVESKPLKFWKVRFNLPTEYQRHGPKLRERYTYAFPVSREYLNGYALPLVTDTKEISLSVCDLYGARQQIQFALDNHYRPAVLLHTENDESPAEAKNTNMQPLKTLVVQSGNVSGRSMTDCQSRHVFPEKIPLEHAFWKNVISAPNMSPKDSFKWKNKYNCPFVDEASFKARKNGSKCPEGCRTYCGGTAMAQFYREDAVLTNYLTDPDVEGFKVQLFWDKGYSHPVNLLPATDLCCNYPKNKESQALSRRLTLKRLIGSLKNGVKGRVHETGIDVQIKPGATIYAKILNTFSEKHLATRAEGRMLYWWDHVLPPDADRATSLQSAELADLNNPPQEVAFVHAVDRPLVCPKIVKLYSMPKDHKQIAHLGELLHGEYCAFSADMNVIALRTHMDTSDPQKSPSLAKFDLTSHFERLDAFAINHFLQDVIPTGGLELWMRKEEYTDDPLQIVSGAASGSGQSPEKPVHQLTDPANQFTREFKMEFTGDVLSQLKSSANIQRIEDEHDLFKAFISRLLVDVDVKSHKFELREYYLRGTSKFGGYFSSDSSNSENFSIPEPSTVLADSSLRFKVLLLNNAQPSKPEVISAVTSIRELRRYHDSEHLESTQSGNIVTIYLNRGRLNSGGGERIALLVDSNSRYNHAFKKAGYISRAGRDIVSDISSPRMKYLQFGDIVVPPKPLNRYDAKYDDELGIYHYLPVFDVDGQCWKFQVELNIKTPDGLNLHNPFVNFVLLHYQPFSINYNTHTPAPTLSEIQTDCRLSDPILSCWGQLLPERNLSIHFSKPQWLLHEHGKVKLTLSFDITSLNFGLDNNQKPLLRSNFIVSVEGSDDRIAWRSVSSCMIINGTEGDIKKRHALISDENLESTDCGFYEASIHLKFKRNLDYKNANTKSFSYFRVSLVEVEWFDEKNPDFRNLDINILHDEDLRVRYVELVE